MVERERDGDTERAREGKGDASAELGFGPVKNKKLSTPCSSMSRSPQTNEKDAKPKKKICCACPDTKVQFASPASSPRGLPSSPLEIESSLTTTLPLVIPRRVSVTSA